MARTTVLVRSFQKVTSSLRKYFIVVALEGQPSLLGCSYLFVCFGCFAVGYDLGFMPTTSGSCAHEKLGLTRLVEREKPKSCLVD